jgi:hypothetical protein
MIELAPCPACRRHVRGLTCPFCGATTNRRAPIDLGAGRVSRAIVFASATLTAAGCAHHAKPASDETGEDYHHGGGGCTDPDQTRIDQLEAQKKEAQKLPDGPEKKSALRDLDEQLREARMPQCMPYGAPPARRRVV